MDKIRNKVIKEIMGVQEKPDITDIIEKKRLQWYGHVKRMPRQIQVQDLRIDVQQFFFQ